VSDHTTDEGGSGGESVRGGVQGDGAGAGYEPPRLVDLGTLAELTRGGTTSMQSDGMGTAGGSAMLP
jgi:hypothetical protein